VPPHEVQENGKFKDLSVSGTLNLGHCGTYISESVPLTIKPKVRR